MADPVETDLESMSPTSKEGLPMIDPYLETDRGRLYEVDAVELIEHLSEEDKTVQTVFADPPYNIGKADWDEVGTDEEYLDWIVDWIQKVGNIIEDDGSLFVMGFPEGLADIKYRVARDCDWYDSMRWLAWHYRNKPQMAGNGWTRSHEGVLWIRKNENWKFRMDRVRIPYNQHTEKYPVRSQGQTSLFGSEEGYTWDPDIEGAKPRDVIDIPSTNNASKESTSHPTQKPEELLRKIIWATTDKDDLVLDPFGGSGTTYSVCEQLGRNWIGTETETEYLELISERLSSLEHREDSEYWTKHDLDRRDHRQKTRYGSE